ncbi:hypothetical protein BH11ACT4_BH11ACT4_01060 [soil metagenome]
MQRIARHGPRSAVAVALGIVLATTLALPAVAVPVSWTSPTTLSSTADAWDVQLATAPDGSITAVWSELVVSATDVITAIWIVFTGPIGVVQAANSVAAVPPPGPGPGPALAPTGSTLGVPLALLGSGLIAAGVLLVRPRRLSTHRAER